MAWIYKSGALSQEEMENNADIVTNYLRELAYSDETIAGILGNMQNESTINPARHELGGQGYGLVQWTPQSVLIQHASNMGISDYENGDNQLAVLNSEITANPSANNEWYSSSAFISPYYNSGATSDMVGITGVQFISNEMGWTADKLAIMFMVAYERPTYDPTDNHYKSRMEDALTWYEYIGGVSPHPNKKPIPSWSASKWVQYGAIATSKKRRIHYALYN